MTAVWLRVASELRARRRSIVALALLVGLGGGSVIAAVQGARRTDSAYPRFLRAHGGAHMLAADFVGEGRQLSVEDASKLPAVVGVQKLRFYLLQNPLEIAAVCGGEPLCEEVGEAGFFTAEARSPDRRGPPVDTYKIIEGRAPDPSRPEEAVLTIPGERVPRLRVGSRFRLAGAPFFPEFERAAREKPLEIHIVGRAAVPGDFPPQTGDETVALRLTPAFYERYPEQGFGFPGGLVLRLDGKPRAEDRFREGYTRVGGTPEFTLERSMQDANVQRSFHLQAIALWLLAGLAGVAFLLVFVQTLARHIFLESGDHPTLRALGWSRPQLVAADLLRALIVASAGAAVAVAIAIALSPLTPTGLARVAEPDPGPAVDAVAVGLGALALIGAVLLLSVFPAWRAARAHRPGADEARPARLAETLAKLGRLPALVAGARLALQRGTGRGSMPVRSTIAALTLGLLVLTASATFAASLDRFLDRPGLYGVTWDARVGIDTLEEQQGRLEEVEPRNLYPVARGLVERDPRVRGVSVGKTGLNLAVGEHVIEGLAMEPAAGDAPMPPLTAGRYPVTQDGDVQEIVLAPRTMEATGARIGDVIGAAFLQASEEPRPVRVVGTAIVPLFIDASRLGEGALMTPAGLARASGPTVEGFEIGPGDLFVAGTADLDVIAGIVGGPDARDQVHIWDDRPPTDVVNFGRVQKMPLVLGFLLGLFAAATLTHTLITAIGRRRRDLAILKTLGFVRGQVRRAVRAQALILTMLALVVGVPAGIAAGRWLWTFYANDLGVVPDPVIYGVTVAGGIIATLVVASAIAALPARAAARTEPASVLRTE